MKQKSALIDKARLDALTDGVFAFAMTLLVIDLKFPEDFNPTSGEQLLDALADLEGQFLVYVVSFMVLGLRWVSLAKLSRSHETVEDRYVSWALAHLFMITVVPFSTLVVGRYASLPPAIWLYCGTTILTALIAMRLAALAAVHIGAADAFERRIGLIVLIIVSLLVIAVSLVQPKYAMWVFLLNLFAPAARYWWPGPKAKA
ncbi:MAG TPA: TMEM175 family protein [Xanthobacteraceae bacterium]|nr:TMEM175 family protein [Xanthobacteraceae bacterium]